jgi:uncharacterized membrane protein YidH (DUF202 family)
MIKIIGVVLIALGLLALVYQGFTYTETKQDAKIGSLTVQHDEQQTVPVSPIVGTLAIVAGVCILVFSRNRSG